MTTRLRKLLTRSETAESAMHPVIANARITAAMERLTAFFPFTGLHFIRELMLLTFFQ
jgi:hypothetical protein